jgi:hypothetical protein
MYRDVGFIIRDEIWNRYRTDLGPGHRAPAYTTGIYGDSLTITPQPEGVIVAATASYGGVLEEGSSPHYPPKDLINAWLQNKGWDSSERTVRAVQRHIGEEGTPARHFITNVFRYDGALAEINARVRMAIDDLAFSMGFASGGGGSGGLAKDSRGMSISPRTGKSFYNVRGGDVGAGGNRGRFAKRQ